MTDKVHPSSKPTTNGGITAPTIATHPIKTHLYNPKFRPQPPSYRHHRRHSRCHFSCCCCFIWTSICILTLILIASIIGCALYMLYHPKEPTFTISSLRVAKLNVTSSADSYSSHLVSLFNMTITIKNPNNHVTFSCMPFSVSAFSKDVQVGNGTLDAMKIDAKNATSARVMLSASQGLDAESATSLRSDLKNKRKGLALKIFMDTEVEVIIEEIKSKMVGIRVSCDGIKGVVSPHNYSTSDGKAAKQPSPVVANIAGAKCKIDLRIKIWNWKITF